MSTIAKNQTTTLTDYEKAEQEAAIWLRAKEQKEQAENLLKESAKKLSKFALRHQELFAMNKTAVIGHVKLKWVSEGEILTDDNYNEKWFAAHYPECVKSSLQLSRIKGLIVNEDIKADLELCGVRLKYIEKFKIEKK